MIGFVGYVQGLAAAALRARAARLWKEASRRLPRVLLDA